MSLLPPDELQRLTGKTRPGNQRRWLDTEGIPYQYRDGRIIVSSRHVEAWIDGRPIQTVVKPDFSAVR